MFKIGDKVVCADNVSRNENDMITIVELKENKIYTIICFFFDIHNHKRTTYCTDKLFLNGINSCYYYPSNRFMSLENYKRKQKLIKLENA